MKYLVLDGYSGETYDFANPKEVKEYIAERVVDLGLDTFDAESMFEVVEIAKTLTVAVTKEVKVKLNG